MSDMNCIKRFILRWQMRNQLIAVFGNRAR